MESSAYHRRASEAEQLAVECDPAMLKMEPEWGECDVSEAAEAEGLYAEHEIKHELVGSEPELLHPDLIFTMHDMLAIKEETLHELKSEGGAHMFQQHGLRSCYVKLERLPEEEVHISWPFYMCRNCNLIHCIKRSLIRSRRRKKRSRRKRR